MSMKAFRCKIAKLAYFGGALMYVGYAAATAYAASLPDSEIKALQDYSQWVQCSDTGQNTNSLPTGQAARAPVYLLGDSILEGAYFNAPQYLKSDLNSAGLQPQADASGGRGMIYPGTAPQGSLPGRNQGGLNALSTDLNAFGPSSSQQALGVNSSNLPNTIVIELGTNASNSAGDFRSQMTQAINTAKKLDPQAGIFWVNLFSDVAYKTDYNNVIDQVASSEGIGVIDTTQAHISLSPDHIHPDTAGYKTLSTVITDQLKTGGSGGSKTISGTPRTGVAFDDNQSGDTGNQTTIDDDGVDPSPTGSQFHQSGTSYASGRLGALHTSYIALNPGWAQSHGLVLGDIAALTWHGRTIYAVYGDNHVGNTVHAEISVHAAIALSGSEQNLTGVHTVVFPNTHQLLHNSVDQSLIDQIGSQIDPGGIVSGSSGAGTSSNGANCCPNTASTDNTGNSSQKPTIVLDPGHAGANTEQIDPKSGLETIESGGAPGEMQAMWNTAQDIKKTLLQDGYNVVLTKNSEADTAGFVTKVARADAANPSLVVSMHYTPGVHFGTPNGHFGVTPQQVGRFRQNKDNGKRKTFTDAALARQSQQYAQDIASGRASVGDHANVVPLDQSFPANRPDIKAFGDISMVQLLSNAPWVYNEVGADGFNEKTYSEGITKGIEKAIPPSGSTVAAPSTPNGTDTTASACCPQGGNGAGGGNVPTSLTGADNGEKIYNFFLQLGLSPAQSAGVVANLYNESGWDPLIAGPNPSAVSVWGVAQWTGSSLSGGYIPDKTRNHITGPDGDLLTQLQVLWAEMNGKSSTWPNNMVPGLEKITDPGQAAIYFRDNFERCNTGVSSCADRASVGQQMFQRFAHGSNSASGGASGSSSCGSGGASCVGTQATGNAKILCEAEQFNGIYYEWSGGHQGIAAFKHGCPNPANPPNNQPHGGPVNGDPGGLSGNPSPCATDCSGLVSISVDLAFGVTAGWTVASLEGDSANWQQIPIKSAQAGDVVVIGADHVEIVDHYDPKTGQMHTFGSHSTGTKTGAISSPLSNWTGAYRYIGKGHG
ncbi:MAG TPA: phage tail tip lysozyme [Candidatus Saccharimonadia bacterium]|nr:phage tail tip lysozyme [Candidatus Saccharimonadia bacterium]